MESFGALLRHYGWYAVLAFVLTVFATPVAARLAWRLGVLDVPDRDLKPHARPTPYLGGAAICLGWTVALLAALPGAGPEWHVLLTIMLGGVATTALGLIDDVWNVSPKLRLLGCALIAGAVILHTGIADDLAISILWPFGITPPPVVGIPLSFLLGLFIVLGACNSANLIDGLDGLCAGVTAVISLGFFVVAGALAIYVALYDWQHAKNATRLILSLALLGCTLGFLPFNFNPARIFMGDAGSMLLGYNCGMMILLLNERAVLRWTFGGLMIFALPIFDTALAIVRRWRAGRSIFAGDRSHFYDQLVDRGLSVRRVVVISYGLAAVYAILGCGTVVLAIQMRYLLVIYALSVLATIAVIILTGMAGPEQQPKPGTPDRSAA